MRPLPPELKHLTSDRFNALSRREMLAAGCSNAMIHRWVQAGILEIVGRGHYRLAGAAPHRLTALSSAIARCGDGARVGGAWACGLHRMEGFDLSGDDRIAIPPGRRVRGVGFRVVRTEVLPVDQTSVGGLATVTAARALIDVAATHPPERVRKAFDSARRMGLVRLDRLSRRAQALGRTPGASQMRQLIASGALLMEGEGERRLDRIWRPGDPRPVPQVWVTPRIRLDFAFIEARLALEHDDRRHDYRRSADYHRDLSLAAMEIQTLRLNAALLGDPAGARQRILRVRSQRMARGLAPIVPLELPR